jgi:lysozyme
MIHKLQPSQACLDLIKRFESCRLTGYKDANGFPTIGWGHKLGPHETFVKGISQGTADYLLRCDAQVAANDVNSYVTQQLSQNQFDGMTSWTFNLGGERLRESTLLTYLNANRILDAANELLKWDHAGGKVSDGLETRREAERELFLS